MSTNFYMQDKLIEEQQRNWIHEIEQQTIVAQAPHDRHRSAVRHLIGRSGALLVKFGIWLEQVERRDTGIVASKRAFLSGHLH